MEKQTKYIKMKFITKNIRFPNLIHNERVGRVIIKLQSSEIQMRLSQQYAISQLENINYQMLNHLNFEQNKNNNKISIRTFIDEFSLQGQQIFIFIHQKKIIKEENYTEIQDTDINYSLQQQYDEFNDPISISSPIINKKIKTNQIYHITQIKMKYEQIILDEHITQQHRNSLVQDQHYEIIKWITLNKPKQIAQVMEYAFQKNDQCIIDAYIKNKLIYEDIIKEFLTLKSKSPPSKQNQNNINQLRQNKIFALQGLELNNKGTKNRLEQGWLKY